MLCTCAFHVSPGTTSTNLRRIILREIEDVFFSIAEPDVIFKRSPHVFENDTVR